MGKYSELINSAKKPTNQKTKKPESQNTNSADNAPSDDVESITKKSGNPKLVTPELQTEEEEEKEKEVNICIKVPISKRRYWMSKAKQEGITVTSVIIEALTQKFGKP